MGRLRLARRHRGALGLVVVVAAAAAFMVSASVASAAGSWGTACYVQAVNGGATITTLRCNVTPETGHESWHYYAVAYYPPGDSATCSATDNRFCGWVTVTPGTPFTITVKTSSTLNVLVFNEASIMTSFTYWASHCDTCQRRGLSGANDNTIMINGTAAGTTAGSILGAADHAPLEAELVPPAPAAFTDCTGATSTVECTAIVAMSNNLHRDFFMLAGVIFGAALLLPLLRMFSGRTP